MPLIQNNVGHTLQVGDKAVSLYAGRSCIVTIIGRKEGADKIQFQVNPPLANTNRKKTSDTWIDSNWFTPIMKTK